jgi:hypothetical protein
MTTAQEVVEALAGGDLVAETCAAVVRCTHSMALIISLVTSLAGRPQIRETWIPFDGVLQATSGQGFLSFDL